jgi:hypothetical protein
MATLTEDMIGGRGLGFGGDASGGGILTGLILGALLGRGGLGFGGNVNGVDSNLVTTTDLIQQTLGDVKASIPFNEAQVQLALSAAVSSLTNQNTSNTQYLSQGQTAIQLAQQAISASLARDIANVDTNVDRQSTAIQIAINSDGEKTRALITNNRIADLEQQLTVSQLRESEGRQIIRENENSHNVTVQVNQQQAQAQMQFQRQDFILNQLLAGFGQIARATNSNVIVGNTGASTTGAQTANPTNVNA